MWNYKFGVPMPYICITPATNAGWDTAILDKLLDHVLDAYNADPDRVSLTGFSMGGMGTYTWACERPDRFAALAVLSGNAARQRPDQDSPHPDLDLPRHARPGRQLRGRRAGRQGPGGARRRTCATPSSRSMGHGIQANLQHTQDFWAWLASFRRPKAE